MIHCKCFLSCLELYNRLSPIKLFPTDKLCGRHQQGCGTEIITLMTHRQNMLNNSQLIVIQQGGNTSVSILSTNLLLATTVTNEHKLFKT
jgi:hypothetical protein